MEMIPKAIVIGLFSSVGLSEDTQPTTEKLSRVWTELAPTYGLTQLQLDPSGTAAVMEGPTAGITVQPPLLQFRQPILQTPDRSADGAQMVFEGGSTPPGCDWVPEPWYQTGLPRTDTQRRCSRVRHGQPPWTIRARCRRSGNGR